MSKKITRSSWGSIKTKKKSKYLYIGFPYMGKSVEMPTEYTDTTKNRKELRKYLAALESPLLS